MTVIRTARAAEGKFVQIANGALQDRRLSFRARGILAYVLSLPPDQYFTAKWLESRAPEGREAVRAALRQLEEFGYLSRVRTRDGGGHWAWEQVMTDAASSDAESAQVAPCDGNPYNGNPSDGKPSDKRPNTEPRNTHDLKDGLPAGSHSKNGCTSAPRTVQGIIDDMRSAVAEVHGQREADELQDDDALGLWARYVGDRHPRDMAAYMVKILSDAPYLDTLLANSEPVCCSCVQYYSNCQCGTAVASLALAA